MGFCVVGNESPYNFIMGRSVDNMPPPQLGVLASDKQIWASVDLAIDNYVCQGLGDAIF